MYSGIVESVEQGKLEPSTVLKAMLSDGIITMEEIKTAWLMSEQERVQFIKQRL
jgi:deoxyribose-phosphate aldolase